MLNSILNIGSAPFEFRADVQYPFYKTGTTILLYSKCHLNTDLLSHLFNFLTSLLEIGEHFVSVCF